MYYFLTVAAGSYEHPIIWLRHWISETCGYGCEFKRFHVETGFIVYKDMLTNIQLTQTQASVLMPRYFYRVGQKVNPIFFTLTTLVTLNMREKTVVLLIF